jgi:hypothetical protein
MKRTLKATGLVLLLFALAGCATQSNHLATPATQRSSSALTAQEYTFARNIVRSEISRLRDVVTSATVTVSEGKVLDPNTGYPCTSGRVLNIKLIGDFIYIVIRHPAVLPGSPQPDYTVHAEMLTADAKTGRPCLIGVQVGKVAPEPGAVSLPLT